MAELSSESAGQTAMSPSVAASSETVDRELPCDKCGYNLFAQPMDGRCPECGEPVARSLPAMNGLTKHELGTLIVRAFALWCFVNAVLYVILVPPLVYGNQRLGNNLSYQMWLGVGAYVGGYSVIGALAWGSGKWLGRKLLPINAVVQSRLTFADAKRLVVIAIGIYFFTTGIIGFSAGLANGARFDVTASNFMINAGLFGVLRIVVGGLMLIGWRGIRNLPRKLRTAAVYADDK